MARHLQARQRPGDIPPRPGQPGRRRSHRGPDRALIASSADECVAAFLPLRRPKPALDVRKCRLKASEVASSSRLRRSREALEKRPVQPESWCRRRDLNPHPPHGGPDFEWGPGGWAAHFVVLCCPKRRHTGSVILPLCSAFDRCGGQQGSKTVNIRSTSFRSLPSSASETCWPPSRRVGRMSAPPEVLSS
jgi:hypothetical protein